MRVGWGVRWRGFVGYVSEGRRRGVGLIDCQHGSNRKMADGDLEEGKSEWVGCGQSEDVQGRLLHSGSFYLEILFSGLHTNCFSFFTSILHAFRKSSSASRSLRENTSTVNNGSKQTKKYTWDRLSHELLYNWVLFYFIFQLTKDFFQANPNLLVSKYKLLTKAMNHSFNAATKIFKMFTVFILPILFSIYSSRKATYPSRISGMIRLSLCIKQANNFPQSSEYMSVSYTHLTLPTIYSV